MNIVEWIVQMEGYFSICSLKPDAYVEFMLQKIAHPYFKEVVPYKDLEYLDFREKLVEVFGEPDMATARLHELKKAEQQYGEPIGEYMNRLRLLVLRAHPDLSHKDRDRILTTEFVSGLRDQDLSMSLAMAAIKTSADAEKKATEGESVRRNARSKKSTYMHCLPEQPAESPEDPVEEAMEAIAGEEDLTAAFGEQRGGRGAASGSRPWRGFAGRGRGGPTRGATRGRCFNCNEFGHFQANCPRRLEQASATALPAGEQVCSFCRGPHLVRFCPKYAASLREIAKPSSMGGGPQDARAPSGVVAKVSIFGISTP